jgi:hypothetical protein
MFGKPADTEAEKQKKEEEEAKKKQEEEQTKKKQEEEEAKKKKEEEEEAKAKAEEQKKAKEAEEEKKAKEAEDAKKAEEAKKTAETPKPAGPSAPGPVAASPRPAAPGPIGAPRPSGPAGPAAPTPKATVQDEKQPEAKKEEQPAEAKDDKPAEKKEDKPAEEKDDKSEEKKDDKPAEKKDDTPAEAKEEKPAEAKTERANVPMSIALSAISKLAEAEMPKAPAPPKPAVDEGDAENKPAAPASSAPINIAAAAAAAAAARLAKNAEKEAEMPKEDTDRASKSMSPEAALKLLLSASVQEPSASAVGAAASAAVPAPVAAPSPAPAPIPVMDPAAAKAMEALLRQQIEAARAALENERGLAEAALAAARSKAFQADKQARLADAEAAKSILIAAIAHAKKSGVPILAEEEAISRAAAPEIEDLPVSGKLPSEAPRVNLDSAAADASITRHSVFVTAVQEAAIKLLTRIELTSVHKALGLPAPSVDGKDVNKSAQVLAALRRAVGSTEGDSEGTGASESSKATVEENPKIEDLRDKVYGARARREALIKKEEDLEAAMALTSKHEKSAQARWADLLAEFEKLRGSVSVSEKAAADKKEALTSEVDKLSGLAGEAEKLASQRAIALLHSHLEQVRQSEREKQKPVVAAARAQAYAQTHGAKSKLRDILTHWLRDSVRAAIDEIRATLINKSIDAAVTRQLVVDVQRDIAALLTACYNARRDNVLAEEAHLRLQGKKAAHTLQAFKKVVSARGRGTRNGRGGRSSMSPPRGAGAPADVVSALEGFASRNAQGRLAPPKSAAAAAAIERLTESLIAVTEQGSIHGDGFLQAGSAMADAPVGVQQAALEAARLYHLAASGHGRSPRPLGHRSTSVARQGAAADGVSHRTNKAERAAAIVEASRIGGADASAIDDDVMFSRLMASWDGAAVPSGRRVQWLLSVERKLPFSRHLADTWRAAAVAISFAERMYALLDELLRTLGDEDIDAPAAVISRFTLEDSAVPVEPRNVFPAGPVLEAVEILGAAGFPDIPEVRHSGVQELESHLEELLTETVARGGNALQALAQYRSSYSHDGRPRDSAGPAALADIDGSASQAGAVPSPKETAARLMKSLKQIQSPFRKEATPFSPKDASASGAKAHQPREPTLAVRSNPAFVQDELKRRVASNLAVDLRLTARAALVEEADALIAAAGPAAISRHPATLALVSGYDEPEGWNRLSGAHASVSAVDTDPLVRLQRPTVAALSRAKATAESTAAHALHRFENLMTGVTGGFETHGDLRTAALGESRHQAAHLLRSVGSPVPAELFMHAGHGHHYTGAGEERHHPVRSVSPRAGDLPVAAAVIASPAATATHASDIPNATRSNRRMRTLEDIMSPTKSSRGLQIREAGHGSAAAAAPAAARGSPNVAAKLKVSAKEDEAGFSVSGVNPLANAQRLSGKLAAFKNGSTGQIDLGAPKAARSPAPMQTPMHGSSATPFTPANARATGFAAPPPTAVAAAGSNSSGWSPTMSRLIPGSALRDGGDLDTKTLTAAAVAVAASVTQAIEGKQGGKKSSSYPSPATAAARVNLPMSPMENRSMASSLTSSPRLAPGSREAQIIATIDEVLARTSRTEGHN